MIQRAWTRLEAFTFPVYCGLRPRALEDILKPTPGFELSFDRWELDLGAGSLWDLTAISAIVKTHAPTVCFEIGTGHGRATYHMARNTPATTRIATLDLRDDEVVGLVFRGQPEEQKIQRLVGDSTTFDFSPWIGRVDFVYVDGDHSFAGVDHDTETAFNLLAPGGTILWDDFTPHWTGVVKALRKHARNRPIFRIPGTKLAYYVDET